MADVQTTPEVESVPVTKTADKVEEPSVIAEEAVTSNGNGVHTNGNGETNGDASHLNGDHAETNGVTNGSEDVNGHDAITTTNGEAEGEETAALEVDADAAPATEGADAVGPEEEPKEEAPPMVKLFQFPCGKEIPSTSPFCLKVETFLRINGIPYKSIPGYKMGKKGKLPWIEYNGERIVDSKFIIKYLSDKFEADLDTELSEEQVAIGRAVTSMLEENTYWALIYNRYVDNFPEFKKFMAQGGGIGFNVSQKMFQRKMRSNLEGHGMGRHLKSEVYQIAEDDLSALSKILGDKEFLLGDKISSFDCALFGLCANILYCGMDNPMKTFIQEHATNVSELCNKIKETYWADHWVEVIEAEKAAEPALKKGFSFRKKKTPKAPKSEAAADASDEATSSDEPSPEATPEQKPEDESATVEVSEEKAEDAEAPTEETPATSTSGESTTETKDTSETKETINPTTEEPSPETTDTIPEA